ncbi:flagellar basal body rod protein FlgG [Bacillus sp. MUM 13]|uniref:flagellar basal body rod protein FlgG n=1 Tax=Bacillus sp. MUM 13 TaxID=1678001 RepID=UPI0008F5C08F|nr:flagellar basal body rod protein FlgG [Bacillus sp. MUM 13]OIK15288.1 flagellar basal-body rod protein FlgF [Bacillus sp. MUM 13]
MLRSMYSGISGMKNFQTKLDVIGNNIANVNTYGFKKGRTVFKDMVSQTMQGASGPSSATGKGGINPKQVGLGAQMSAIDTIDTQGSMQTTGRTLDLAISGDGYFTVYTGGSNSEQFYTRAGNFYLDKDGYIVNSDGLYLKGANGVIQILPGAKDITIGKDGTVSYTNSAGTLTPAGQIEMAKFSNPGGLSKAGNNLFKDTNNSGAPVPGASGTNGLGSIESGMLEMSNVDLSEEFTDMIVAQRGFQANTRIITTSDQILEELVNLKR